MAGLYNEYLNKLDINFLDKNRIEEINYNLNSHSTKNCKSAPLIYRKTTLFIIVETTL